MPEGWRPSAAFPKADASIIYAAENPSRESLFLVSASNIGVEHQPTANMMADEIIANYQDTGEIRSSERSPKAIGPVNGVRLTIRTTNAGNKISIVAWVGAHNGREYRMMVISPGNEAGAVLMLNDWLTNFRLLDTESKIASADLPAPAQFTSRRFGYALALPKGAGWAPADIGIVGIPSVEYAAAIGGHTIIAVQALHLGADAEPEDVAKAMLRFTASPWDVCAEKTPMTFGDGFSGYQFSTNADGKERPFSYRGVVVRGKQCAFLVIGWTTRKDQLLNINAALRTLQLAGVPAPGRPDAPTAKYKSLDAIFAKRDPVPEISTLGMAQNELGLLAHARGDYLAATKFYSSALDDRLEPTICLNLLRSLLESRDSDQALKFGTLAIKQFPQNDPLSAEMALVYDVSRQPEKAVELYRVLFPDRLHDDERFARFIDLLLERHDTDLAKRHIAAYKKHTDNDLIATLEADMLVEMNEPAKAADLLKKKLTGRMPEERLLMTYCGALVKAERLDEALRELDTLEKDNGASAALHIIRGHTLVMAGQFDKAKTAYEAALRLKPNDPELKQYVLNASAYVGQGSNSALNTPIDAIPLDESLLAKNTETLDKSAGAGYRLYAKASRFEKDRKQRTTEYQLIEIYDQNGVDAFNMLSLDLNPLSERVYVNTLEVLDESGKQIAQGNRDTYYVQDQARDSIASFKQSVKLPVPGLRPGCTIRLVATREDRNSPDKLPFTEEWLGHVYPTATSAYVLAGDIERIKTIERNGVRKSVNGRTITWTVSQPQRMYFEPMMPPLQAFIPYVAAIDSDKDWPGEAKTYMEMIAPRLEANPAVKKEYASLNIGGLTPMQKVRAIVDHVDRKFTYTALAFGPRARMPTDPADIIRNRYGDCKDMSLLTHLLLREAGVKSNLALVKMHGSVSAQLPSLDQFDHMIVNLPDCDGAWWIDCTGDDIDPISVTPPPAYLEGREALVLDAADPKLVRLPDWDATTSNVNIERTVKLLADGRMNVSDTVTLNGAIAHYYRASLRAVEASRREATIVTLCALRSNEIRDFTARSENVDDYLKPLTMHLEYSPRQKLHTAGTRLVGDLPSSLEKQLLAPELIRDRRTPMSIEMGMFVKVKLTLALPQGMELEGINTSPQVLNGNFGKGQVRFQQASANLTGELHLQSPPVTAPASDYEKFCEWRQSVVDAWSIPLIVTKTK